VESHYTASDAVLAAQHCIELSVKAVLSLLDVPFPPNHGWERKQLVEIVNDHQILNRLKDQGLSYTIPLPRLIFRMNVWSKFYEESKYGFEAGDMAPAQDLFEKEDAVLAVKHADDAYRAARRSADRTSWWVAPGALEESDLIPPKPEWAEPIDLLALFILYVDLEVVPGEVS
jgi:HEPN domain-containing protein